MKLYVGGLSYSVTDTELEELFTTHGKVTSTAIIKDRATGQSKGFGFVEMAEDGDARKAIQELNGKELSGRALTVNQARPQVDRAGSSSSRRSF
jgi:RNA recognition motif-containing protein